MQTKTKTMWQAIFICALASTFYVYDFFLRVSPNVMTHQLMRDFHIHAAKLGFMSACIFWGYVVMQVPAGLLIDRFGARRLLTIFAIGCGLGTVIFAKAKTYWLACVGLTLIGLGAGLAFIAVLVLSAYWFDKKYFGIITGLVQFTGSIGAIAAEAPLAHLIKHFGWRHSMLWAGYLGFVFAICYLLFIRNRPPQPVNNALPETHLDLKTVCNNLIDICKKPQTWWIGLYSFMIWTPPSIFPSLWGVPALERLYSLDKITAAHSISWVWVGIAVAGPVFAWWSDRIKRRILPLVVAGVVGLISMCAIVFWLTMPLWLLNVMLFLIGAAASSQPVCFAYVQDINKPDVVGTAVGFNNMCLMLGTPLLMPVVGMILQKVWVGIYHAGHVPFYTAMDYQYALSFLPLLFGCALLVAVCFLEETHCEHLAEQV